MANAAPSLKNLFRQAAENWRSAEAPHLDGHPDPDAHWSFLVSGLDASALRRFARYYRNMARLADTRAATLDTWAAQQQEAEERTATLRTIPQIMERYIAAGLSIEAAAATHKAMGCDSIEIVWHHWRAFLKTQQATERARRSALITALASQGVTNREIAKRTGMHEVSICRILAKTRATR